MSDPQAQPPGDSNYREPNVGQPQYGQPPNSQPGASPYSTPVVAAPLSEADDRQWASLAHLGGILSFLPSLIIWLVFKDRGRFTNTEAKEALNFQITLLIAYVAITVVSTFLALVTFGIGGLLAGLGWIVWLAGVIFSIMGFVQAKDGKNYRYPFAVRLIK
ncbi:DUF4870 domain-containing protein [Cryobacterium sp. TMT1-66-1]|uniref:DUF4870 domain-containing protein n=1 Tax=Cryobacterium sp. TMT1-66-1 TaxID=1259242 RepID=UPI00106B06BB|nr:DUF4870 domain-containing protein [Cryobacterium sp. TMT1-66-1]TFD03604.1 DUF4870 domain-containing protein [Cryobacterium sp. TMT1-66-1]